MQQKMPWEEDWSQPQPGPQVVMPVSPMVQQKDAVDLRNAQLSGDRTSQQIAQDAATSEAQRRTAEANATRAAAEARIAEIQAAQGNQGKGLSPEVRQKAIAQFNSAAQLDNVIADLKARFAEGPGATHGIAGLRDYFGTPTNQRFDTAASGARGIVRNALGLTGGEANTAGEAQMNLGAYVPSSKQFDGTIEDSIGRLAKLRDNARRMSIQTLGGQPDANGNVTPVASAPVAATGVTRTEKDPKRTATLDALIRGGADIDTINATMTGMGGTPVSPDDVQAARAYLQKNPGFKGPIADATNTVSQSTLQRLAASPLAGAATGVANGLTGGFLDEGIGGVNSLLTGRPLSETIAEADQAKQAINAAQPVPSFLGNVAGGYGSMLTAGAGVKALGLAARLGRAAPLIGDLAYGGVSGAGEMNDNRIGGAAAGALGAGVGRGLASGATGLFGRMVRGSQNPSSRFLADRGVRLTGGEALGGRWKALEDKATSQVGAGDLILNRQNESVMDLNRGVANDALSHINAKVPDGTEIGAPLHQYGQQAFNNAYGNARAGMTFMEDAPYQKSMFDLSQRAQNGALTDEAASRLDKIVHNTVTRRIGPNGGMSGDTYKTAASELRSAANKAADPELRDALKEARTILDDAASRHSAPDAVAAMKGTDTGYAKWKIYQDAASRVAGEPGVASPAQLKSAVMKADGSAGRNRYNQGTALLQDWSNAANDVLAQKTGNSGTIDRYALLALPTVGTGVGAYTSDNPVGGGASGGAGGAALGLGALASMAAFNTPAGRAAVERALLARNPAIRQAGDALVAKAPKFGMFGRQLGTTLALPLGQ